MMKKVVFVLASALVLQGCSALFGKEGVFRGKDDDYLNASSIQRIDTGKKVDIQSLEDRYPIPPSLATDEFGDPISLDDFEVPRPVSEKGEKIEDGVKIQKLGEKRWIYLNAPPSQIWPRVQNFLSQNGALTQFTDVEKGIIEVSNFNLSETNTPSSVKIFIEKGIHVDTTEIHLIQRTDKQKAPAQWPETSDNKDVEKAMVKALAQVLAADIGNKTASLLGQNVGGESKSGFIKGASEPTMYIATFKERAQAIFSRSLKNSGYTIWEESDSSINSRVYYAGYLPEAEKSRFYRRMVGLGKRVPKKAKYSLNEIYHNLTSSSDLANLLPGTDVGYSDTPLKAAQGFLIVLVQKENQFDVVIRDYRGQKIPKRYAKNMLIELRKNLI